MLSVFPFCEYSAEPGGPGTVFLNGKDQISSGIGRLRIDNCGRSAVVAMTADCSQFDVLKSGKISYHMSTFHTCHDTTVSLRYFTNIVLSVCHCTSSGG